VKHFLYIVFIFTVSFSSLAGNNDKTSNATKSLSGKVTTANGEEIPAAKITVKETSETFYADINGNFQLKVKADRTYSIIIESLGFSPKEIKSSDLGHFSEVNLQEL
jgi:hypothetical protein